MNSSAAVYLKEMQPVDRSEVEAPDPVVSGRCGESDAPVQGAREKGRRHYSDYADQVPERTGAG